MSVFDDTHAKNMKNPEFAYNYGRTERELEIIELLEPLGECEPSICGKGCRGKYRCIGWAYRHAIRLIKRENK
jgi:hypothetical protein